MGQKAKVHNLAKFDNRPWHFGFALGYNAADFVVRLKPDFTFDDSLLAIRHFRQPGFNIQPLVDWHISDVVSLRFTPGISFQDRGLKYSRLERDSSVKVEEEIVQSTFLDFPLLFKYRSHRINNFATYVTAGAKYAIDMASQEDVNNATNVDKIIKITREDYAAEIGFGFDFFLLYFKFGIELRYSFGLPNVLIDDDTPLSRPIDSLRNKQFLLSFTFEG